MLVLNEMVLVIVLERPDSSTSTAFDRSTSTSTKIRGTKRLECPIKRNFKIKRFEVKPTPARHDSKIEVRCACNEIESAIKSVSDNITSTPEFQLIEMPPLQVRTSCCEPILWKVVSNILLWPSTMFKGNYYDLCFSNANYSSILILSSCT